MYVNNTYLGIGPIACRLHDLICPTRPIGVGYVGLTLGIGFITMMLLSTLCQDTTPIIIVLDTGSWKSSGVHFDDLHRHISNGILLTLFRVMCII